jgi:hypothetical protein
VVIGTNSWYKSAEKGSSKVRPALLAFLKIFLNLQRQTTFHPFFNLYMATPNLIFVPSLVANMHSFLVDRFKILVIGTALRHSSVIFLKLRSLHPQGSSRPAMFAYVTPQRGGGGFYKLSSRLYLTMARRSLQGMNFETLVAYSLLMPASDLGDLMRDWVELNLNSERMSQLSFGQLSFLLSSSPLKFSQDVVACWLTLRGLSLFPRRATP